MLLEISAGGGDWGGGDVWEPRDRGALAGGQELVPGCSSDPPMAAGSRGLPPVVSSGVQSRGPLSSPRPPGLPVCMRTLVSQ